MGCSSIPASISYNSSLAGHTTDNIERHTVRTASLSIEVNDTDAIATSITDDIARFNGYVDHIVRNDC